MFHVYFIVLSIVHLELYDQREREGERVFLYTFHPRFESNRFSSDICVQSRKESDLEVRI